jgi:hypothetical protein
MSITIDPELEARLRARAEAKGITVEAYVEQLMQDEDGEITHTEMLLQEAVDSGDYVELTEEEWLRIEQEAIVEAENRSKRRA